MYCRNCRAVLPANAAVCPGCGAPINSGCAFCPNCGANTAPNMSYCNSCGAPLNGAYGGAYGNAYDPNNYQQQYGAAPYNPKSKVAAGLLGIFLGALGIHNFYLGFTGRGLVQLLLTVLLGFTILVPVAMEIWGLVEGIMILAGSKNVDAKGYPLTS